MKSGMMAHSSRVRVAVGVAVLAIGLKSSRMIPTWLAVILAPVWIGALGLGCLGLSFGARWYYDEALRKQSLRLNGSTTNKVSRKTSTRMVWDDQPAMQELDPLMLVDSDKGTAKGLLHQVLRLILQDFVLPWYSRISPSPAFPRALSQTILRTASNLEARFNGIDVPQLMVNKILPHVTKHMKDYRQVEPFFFPVINNSNRADIHGKDSTVDPAPILQSHRKAPLHESLPAPALPNPIPSIEAHLRQKVGKLLDVVLPEEEKGSETVRIVAREVITCAVLVPVVQMLADPDFWNRMLDQQADRHLQERHQVNQLRAALETAASQPVTTNTIRQRSSLPTISIGTANARNLSANSPQRTPRKGDLERKPTSISINTDSRAFEGFIRSIGKIQNVTEAKRLRHDVEREIRGVKGKLDSETISEGIAMKGKDKTPNTVKRLEAYLARLEAAKRKVDRKVAKLMGVSSTEEHDAGTGRMGFGMGVGAAQPPTLREILSNPSPLSFYMEFMDRRKQARLVQFWLTVESFKNPLEEVDSSDDDEAVALDRMSGSMQRLEGEALETVREDVTMIWSMFLDPSVTAEPVPLRGKLLANIQSAINPDSNQVKMLPLLLDQARKSTFRAQRDIYETMLEDHFQDFVRTDLYRKAMIDLNKAASKKGAQMMELGSKLTAVTSRSSDNDVAAMRQGSLSPIVSSPPLPNQSGQSRWLNQLVGFGTSRSKVEVDPGSPTTPLSGRSRRALGPFPTRTSKLEVASPSVHERAQRELPRARSWTIGRTMPDRGSNTPSVISQSDQARSEQALGFLVGSDEPEPNGRSALFATEDDSEFQSPELGRFPSEPDDDFVQVQRMEAIQAALTSIIDRDDQSRGNPVFSNDDRPRASMDSNVYAISRSSYDPLDWDDRWDPLGAIPSAVRSPDMGSSSRPILGDTGSRASMDSRSRLTQPSFVSPRDRKVFDSADEAPRTDSLFRSLTSRSVPDLSPEDIQLPARKEGVALAVLDTQLSIEIARLGETLIKLDEQDHILDQMIRAADLTGKESELDLLLRSQSDLRRELRATRFRKMQYEQQEIDYRLDPARTRLSIPNATILAEEAGKQIVRYVVEIQQYSMEGEFLQGWAVARRYNEFWDLQHALKASSAVGPEIKARGLDVPAKKLLPKLTDGFVEGRRLALEHYMRSLLGIPTACEHSALKVFLSQSRVSLSGAVEKPSAPSRSGSINADDAVIGSPNLVQNLYHQVTSSLDDIFLKPSMIDVMAEKLNRQAVDMAEAWDVSVTQIGNYGLELGSSVLSPYALRALRTPVLDAHASEKKAFPLSNVNEQQPMGRLPEYNPSAQPQAIVEETVFTTPITDFLVEIFGLKNGDWLRKQALVIVMQQLLGSTIERKVRDGINTATSETSFAKYLDAFQNSLWEDGQRKPPSQPRTDAEKTRSKINAGRKIQAFIPDVAANMIGRSNAQRAARQVFGAMQIRLLNLHIIMTIIDEVFDAMLSAKDSKRT